MTLSKVEWVRVTLSPWFDKLTTLSRVEGSKGEYSRMGHRSASRLVPVSARKTSSKFVGRTTSGRWSP
jgi:hypothetical protein